MILLSGEKVTSSCYMTKPRVWVWPPVKAGVVAWSVACELHIQVSTKIDPCIQYILLWKISSLFLLSKKHKLSVTGERNRTYKI